MEEDFMLLLKKSMTAVHYINQLQYKFSSDAANWVWNTDTVNAKIDELICEYEIIEISNGVLSKNATYMEAIRAWVDRLVRFD